MLAIVLALLLATVEPSAVTSPTATEPAPANAAEPGLKPGERKITVVCRNITKPNSRFVKRQCAEVNADAKQSLIDQEAFREVQQRPMFNTPCIPIARAC